jgi:hypothetical protein
LQSRERRHAITGGPFPSIEVGQTRISNTRAERPAAGSTATSEAEGQEAEEERLMSAHAVADSGRVPADVPAGLSEFVPHVDVAERFGADLTRLAEILGS